MIAIHCLILFATFLGLIDATPVHFDITRREVPADPISKYTPDYLISKRRFDIEPDTCVFYTKSSGPAAQALGKDPSNGYITLWEVWPMEYYALSTTDLDNPLREIMADPGVQRTYFKQMSKAFALMCSGAASLYTEDPDNIPQDGIWGDTEFPTIMRDSNFDKPNGKVVGVTAFDPSNLNNNKKIYQRTQTDSTSAVALPADKTILIARAPPNGLPLNFPDPQVIDDLYGFLNW